MSELTMTLSLSRKLNLGNYESADVFVSVSGVTADTTEDEIQSLLDNRIAWDAVKASLAEKCEEARTKAVGWR